MAGEVPEPGSDALLQWARQASEEFGSNFRTQFYVSWIYEKAGLYKGNKTRRDVATAYNAIWQILEEQFPKRSTWPCWPEQRDLRHGDQHFQDLIHAKPLKKEIIEAMYSLASVEIAAKKGSQTDKPALFEKIYGSPPLPPDVTWSKRENKRGLKSPEESWPVREKHIAKSNITDLFQLFRPAAENPSSGSTDTPEAYRFDRSEQVVKFQTQERSLRHTLSGLSWNPGAKRQGIDISNFVAGTWSYVMLQEMNSDDIERLKCLGFSVVSDEESGLAVGMPSDFLKRPGQKVADLTETLPSGQWALRAIQVHVQVTPNSNPNPNPNLSNLFGVYTLPNPNPNSNPNPISSRSGSRSGYPELEPEPEPEPDQFTFRFTFRLPRTRTRTRTGTSGASSGYTPCRTRTRTRTRTVHVQVHVPVTPNSNPNPNPNSSRSGSRSGSPELEPEPEPEPMQPLWYIYIYISIYLYVEPELEPEPELF